MPINRGAWKLQEVGFGLATELRQGRQDPELCGWTALSGIVATLKSVQPPCEVSIQPSCNQTGETSKIKGKTPRRQEFSLQPDRASECSVEGSINPGSARG